MYIAVFDLGAGVMAPLTEYMKRTQGSISEDNLGSLDHYNANARHVEEGMRRVVPTIEGKGGNATSQTAKRERMGAFGACGLEITRYGQ